MGLVSLPVTVFLYWLMLHYKKESPFPKWGVLCLVLAGAASALLASLLYKPIISVATLIYGTEAVKGTYWWNLLSMFMTAGLCEEVLMIMDLGYAAEGIGPLANHGSRKPLEETVTYL